MSTRYALFNNWYQISPSYEFMTEAEIEYAKLREKLPNLPLEVRPIQESGEACQQSVSDATS